MATITFPNGKSVNFEGNPTPEDVDYVAKQIGITPQTQDTKEVTTPPSSSGALKDVATGALKGVGRTGVELGALGEGVLNQTAGRLISATQGKGLVARDPQKGKYSEQSTSGQQMRRATEPSNFAQKVGFYGEKIAEFGSPIGIYKTATAAPKAAKVLEEVSPKLTAKGVREAYKQGRAKVQGMMKTVTVQPDTATQRAAKSVEDIIKPGAPVAENANRVRSAISKEADTLKTALTSRDVQPIVQPEELQGLFQKALDRIGEDPTMVGNATVTAERIFNKYKSFLPKDKEITASDVLEARQKLDTWMHSIKGDRVFDPATENAMSISLRAIRQEANELLSEKATDVAVKESLARQSAMYDALENLATKGPGEVGTNFISRYLQRHPTQKEIVREGLKGLVPLGVGTWLGSRFFDD